MRQALLVLALVGVACACNSMQQLRVKQEWEEAYSTGVDRIHFGQEIFEYLFQHEPKTRDLFSRVRGDNIYSPQFEAHAMRVLGGLDIAIGLLEEPASFKGYLNGLNEFHSGKVPAEYFVVMRDAITHVVPHHTSHGFSQDAWAACYEVIRAGIVEGVA